MKRIWSITAGAQNRQNLTTGRQSYDAVLDFVSNVQESGVINRNAGRHDEKARSIFAWSPCCSWLAARPEGVMSRLTLSTALSAPKLRTRFWATMPPAALREIAATSST